MDKDYNLNVKENSSVKKSSEYLEKESSREDSNDSFEELLGNLSLEQKGDKKIEIKKNRKIIKKNLFLIIMSKLATKILFLPLILQLR